VGARAALDERVREIVEWHFDPATGSPFWLEYATRFGGIRVRESKGFGDLTF
jgi:hypothetical protein